MPMQSLHKEISGGLRAGAYNVTFPFARMKVSARELQIAAPGLSTIHLAPDQVVGFAEYRSFFGRGCLIHHNLGKYPVPLVFWGNPNRIEETIKAAGFVACGVGKMEDYQTVSLTTVRVVFLSLIGVIIMIGILMMFLSN